MAFVPAAGGAAAEATVGLLDAVAIGLLVTWVVLLGLKAGYRHTLGAILTVLARLFRAVRIHVWRYNKHPLEGAARHVDDLNHAIYNGLGHAAADVERSAAYTFHAAGALQLWIAAEIADLSETWLRGLNDLIHRDIPAAQADVIAHVERRIHGIDRLTKGLHAWVQAQIGARIHKLDVTWTHRLATFRRGIDRTTSALTKSITRVNKYARTQVADIRGVTVKQARRIARLERAVAGMSGAALARLTTRVGRLERTVAGIKAGTIAEVGVAAVVAALARMGLGWLRCRNVKRAGAATCGLPLEALEDLLTVGALAGGSLSLLEFAREMESVVEAMDSVVQVFWEV